LPQSPTALPGHNSCATTHSGAFFEADIESRVPFDGSAQKSAASSAIAPAPSGWNSAIVPDFPKIFDVSTFQTVPTEKSPPPSIVLIWLTPLFIARLYLSFSHSSVEYEHGFGYNDRVFHG
jgi:hypothetical protein